MLPLGVDIGTTRLRVSVVSAYRGGPRVHNMVVRELPEGSSSSSLVARPEAVAEILRDALSETAVRERRCVAALPNDAATIKTVTLPRMSAFERAKAARFEAARFTGYPLEQCTVRLIPREEDGEYFLGVARTDVIRSRVKALRGAGLRPVALDHEGLVWRRALEDADCLIDVGRARTSVIAFGEPVAEVRTFPIGGETITENIARRLGIDARTAERRKCGAVAASVENETGEIVAQVAETILELRSCGHNIRRVALAGNGARVAGLAAALERATGIATSMAEFAAAVASEYPPDVMRAGAPDWLFAFGLALWNAA